MEMNRMITWAITILLIKQPTIWKSEGKGMMLLFGMITDVCLAYNVFH